MYFVASRNLLITFSAHYRVNMWWVLYKDEWVVWNKWRNNPALTWQRQLRTPLQTKRRLQSKEMNNQSLVFRSLSSSSDSFTSSRDISQLDAITAALPTHPKQFRLITLGEGCLDALPTGDQTSNMIANHTPLSEPKKVFSNLQLRDFHWGSSIMVFITGPRLG